LGRGFATVLRRLHDTHLAPTNIAVNLPPVADQQRCGEPRFFQGREADGYPATP